MESKNRHWLPILLLTLLIVLAGLFYLRNPVAPATATEQPVTILELTGLIAVPEAELSGRMAWRDSHPPAAIS
ncbi:MAG: hypothetical protein IPP55_02685 [Anaerolineales bacterium]|nr:hypothetical protein [Anaerolineales bacterium]